MSRHICDGPRSQPSTILLLDGDLKLYKRAGIRRWQATFKLKSRWVRVSTGHHDLAEANIIAARNKSSILNEQAQDRLRKP